MGILGRSEEVVKAQISEALVLLCSQLFQYDLELSVEALVGVKLDRKEIFLYNVQSSALKESKKAVGKRSSQDEDDVCLKDEISDFTDSWQLFLLGDGIVYQVPWIKNPRLYVKI